MPTTVAQALSTYASPGAARDHKADLLVKLAEITSGGFSPSAWERAHRQ